MEVVDEMASETFAEPVPVVEINQIDQAVGPLESKKKKKKRKSSKSSKADHSAKERQKNYSKEKWRRSAEKWQNISAERREGLERSNIIHTMVPEAAKRALEGRVVSLPKQPRSDWRAKRNAEGLGIGLLRQVQGCFSGVAYAACMNLMVSDYCFLNVRLLF
ncbi:hypothetical protein F2Q69_00029783 [Brassica cretica]|uniref:Uncharacterized protein n=1 Tax=Brassica cretica TaxID=69181 RepID=A0A8S9RXU8_BRACR|nr:hypothetical protein F2Q69_00029783 [Brassica cretica]